MNFQHKTNLKTKLRQRELTGYVKEVEQKLHRKRERYMFEKGITCTVLQ